MTMMMMIIIIIIIIILVRSKLKNYEEGGHVSGSIKKGSFRN